MTSGFFRLLARPRPIWLNTLLVGAVAAFGYVLCTRGLVLSDEGYLLLQSWDLSQGLVIYRDMDSFVAPGIWFLLAFVFKIFGPSVFVSRMVVWLAFVALIVGTERLVSRRTSPATGLVAAASMLLFSVWAFPAWTFAFYSPFSVLFALIALDRLLAWHEHEDGLDRRLLLCGFFLGLSIVFKQNYGAFALLGAVLGFAAMAHTRIQDGDMRVADVWPPVAWTAMGVFAAGGPVLLYLLATGSFGDAWQSLVIHPFEFAGQHEIPVAPFSWIFDPNLLSTAVDRFTYLSFPQLNTPSIGPLQTFRGVERLHVLLYWLPLPIFLSGLLLSLRMRERRVEPVLFTVTTVCGGIYLGLYPRADFNHLVNVYQTVIVAGAFSLFEARRRLAESSPRAMQALSVTAGLVVVAYGTVAVIWFVALRSQLSTPVPGPRGGVLIGRMDAENLDYMIRAIEQHSEPGDALLTVPDLAMLNFLTNRPMPSAYYNLYEHHIAFDQGRSVVEGAEESGVQLALTRYNNFFSDRNGLLDYAPVLSNYLMSSFDRVTHGGNDDYVVLLRRSTPKDISPWLNVLEACETGDVSPRQIEIRHHLLFSALYHKSRQGSVMADEGTVTRCRVRVPESGGRLALEIGYRQPFKAGRGATLRARISVVEADGESNDIVAQTFRVIPRSGNGLQLPYRRVAADLDPWAGREIDLVFHTRLAGQVRVHPLDFKGFSQVYRDVRLESRADSVEP